MRIVIFANGDLQDISYERTLLRPDDVVYCANGGIRHAQALDRVPDLVIGDFDSIRDATRDWLAAHEVPTKTHPAEKDQTDLELAIDVAIDAGATALLLLGAAGSRLDHTFTNVSFLARAKSRGVSAELVVGRQHCRLLSEEQIVLVGEAGDTISLIPWGQDVHNVRITNVKWPLDGATLRFGDGLGVSNQSIESEVEVRVGDGRLLMVHHRGPVE